MSQLVAGTGPYSLTKTWAVDGTPTDVGTVTIGIVDGNGDTVVAAGTSTTNNSDGTYTYSLADQPSPDQYTITWTRSDTSADLVDRVELVGNLLFSEIQARTFNAKADATTALKPLASSTEYTDAMIADERERITNNLEYWTGRGWIPRYARVEMSGNDTATLDLRKGLCRTADGYQLHRPGRFTDIAIILSATVSDTAVTVANITVDGSNLVRTDGYWSSSTTQYNVVVEYVYGLPYPVDGVDRIGLKLLIDHLVPSAWPETMLSADTEYGTTRFVQPGGPMDNVSRLPEVNQWVSRHNHKVLMF